MTLKDHALLAAALAAALLARTTPAVADDDAPPDAADGAAGCRALRDKNDTDLKLYEQKQPPVPYKYPAPDTVINSPWGSFFHGIADTPGGLIAATLLPHIGAQYRGEAPAITVSWPWTILVFGPMYSCTRRAGSYVVDGHRVHRIMLEPGLDSGTKGTGFNVRPGYRFIWHPSGWVVGPGIGIGSSIEIFGNKEPFRESLSPELVAHFGNCCSSSYFTFAVRYDHFWKGVNRDIIGGTLGYTFF